MKKTKFELEEEISKIIAEILYEQLGEKAVFVNVVLCANVLSVQATDCFTPAEINLIDNDINYELLQKVKAREFEKVQPVFERRIGEVTGCKVTKIYSMICRDGVRFQVIILSEDIEKQITKKKEVR